LAASLPNNQHSIFTYLLIFLLFAHLYPEIPIGFWMLSFRHHLSPDKVVYLDDFLNKAVLFRRVILMLINKRLFSLSYIYVMCLLTSRI
jgi:hypothetical protein